ncbi:MAG: hypothetical protein HQK60_18050 [Deltaproteobacteria bacterium]|nr:hypothetical protein [Deltaproteobacteria bacterium]
MMQASLSNSTIAICSACFAYQDTETPGPGLCLLFGRPQKRKHDHAWPRVYGIDGPCESFRQANGDSPKLMTLANFPQSAVVTCWPESEPEKKISVNQFLVSLDSQAKAKKATPEEAQTDGMTVKQAAKSLGVKPATINYHIGKDRLLVKQTPKGPVIDPKELDEFVRRWRRNRRQHVFESTAQG